MRLFNFKDSEFACSCGCGLCIQDMDEGLLVKLDNARNRANVPFVITSSIRCEAHNRCSGGKPTSSHLKGRAIDISIKDSAHRYAVLRGLMDAGFNRIGIANTFLHADVDEEKPAGMVWTY